MAEAQIYIDMENQEIERQSRMLKRGSISDQEFLFQSSDDDQMAKKVLMP